MAQFINKILLLNILLISVHISYGQEGEFFIIFKDKLNSKYSKVEPEAFLSVSSIERRKKQSLPITEKDLPVSSAYIDSLLNKNIKILYTSRWLNGALVQGDSEVISRLSFAEIQNSKNISSRLSGQSMSSNAKFAQYYDSLYGNSYTQVSMLSGDLMHKNGFNGTGILIAVIDGGFKNLDKVDHFDNLTKTGKILSTWDFVDREADVYDDSDHGTLVLSVLGGYTKDELIGMAYNADYILLRSETTASETLFEEIYWTFAAEYADSVGADIINSSLGYNTFDNPLDNHKYDDLDGKTTIVTRAAEQAASVGMLVVTSQGNDGNKPWKYLLAPADAPSVLAVGAVDSERKVANFSSLGPTVDGRYKPDVAAMGDNAKIAFQDNTFGFGSGTSFAAPMIAGLAAGIWQAMPHLTSNQLRDSIKQSGSQYFAPNFELGFGIPDFNRTYEVIKLMESINSEVYIFPNVIVERNPQLFANSVFVDSIADISIYNLSGIHIADFSQQLYPGKNDMPFIFTSLAKGMYYIKIFTRKTISSQKLIVQ